MKTPLERYFEAVKELELHVELRAKLFEIGLKLANEALDQGANIHKELHTT